MTRHHKPPRPHTIPDTPLPISHKPPKQPLTTAQRQAQYRAKQKANGFSWVGFWLHFDDFAAGYNDARNSPLNAPALPLPPNRDPWSYTLGARDGYLTRHDPKHPGLLSLRLKKHIKQEGK